MLKPESVLKVLYLNIAFIVGCFKEIPIPILILMHFCSLGMKVNQDVAFECSLYQ